MNFGSFVHNGSDAKEVPHSIAPIAFPIDLCNEVGWQAGERVRHPDGVRTRGERNVMRFS
jgi:hypothetical protein